jgi:hypothetical protein
VIACMMRSTICSSVIPRIPRCWRRPEAHRPSRHPPRLEGTHAHQERLISGRPWPWPLPGTT